MREAPLIGLFSAAAGLFYARESMSDVVSQAEAASGSPDPGGDAAVEDAFGVHVRSGPPLAWLAAIAALSAMAINQVLVPALNSAGKRTLLRELDRWGAFAANLAAVSGLVALCFGLLAFVRHNTIISVRKRVFLGTFAAMFFLPTIALAVLFERQRTTTQLVLLALGGAHVLGAIVCTAAASAAPTRYARVMAYLGAAMAAFALSSQLLEVLSQLQLQLWQAQAQQLIQGLGELCYLGLLVGMTRLLLPMERDMRSRLARLLAFFLLPVMLGALYLAERVLDNDYALLLYHAQRVTLFIDSWPRLYAVPIGLAAASSFAAWFATDPIRRQAAAGVLLLLGSGYTPHAPGRLLTSALALVVIARALIAPGERDTETTDR
jgi:hypothetical protein